jgi:hypothetical protein
MAGVSNMCIIHLKPDLASQLFIPPMILDNSQMEITVEQAE